MNFPLTRIRLLFSIALVAILPALADARAASKCRDDETLRFAILCDRTGGMRSGVFEKAVEKTNAMNPQFAISIGDLIDGYTESPSVWERQWNEVDAILARLKMPFYAVPGNHDISNASLRKVWGQKRGPAYQSFVRNGVLFLLLDSEDLSGGGFGAEQIDFARRALEQNKDARWTFVIFHRPLWLDADMRGYEHVESALQGRPYTVFTGHLHHYLKAVRNGMAHYVVATSGGDSRLRGAAVGEFDHIVMVTMDGCHAPKISNVLVTESGVVPDDILTEDDEPRAAALRDGNWLGIQPLVLDGPEIRRLSVPVLLKNPAAVSLNVSGILTPQNGFSFAPPRIDVTVPPASEKSITLTMVADDDVSVHALNESRLSITLDGAYEFKSGPQTLPSRRALQLDWKRVAPRAFHAISTDAKITNTVWPDSLFTIVRQPMFIKESWDWCGPDDGEFRFAVQHYGGVVHVMVETTDDKLVTSADPLVLQDKVIVTLQDSSGITTREAIAGTRTKNLIALPRNDHNGMIAQFAFSLPAEEKKFRLNIGWVDVDRPENTKPSILWWRPPAETVFGWFAVPE